MTRAATRSWTVAALAAALHASTLAASASPAAPSLAVEKSFGKVAGWSIGYSEAGEGCLAAAPYADGTTVWFGFGGSESRAFLALTNPRWHAIEPGQPYELRIRAQGGGNWHGTFAGFDHDGARGLFETGIKKEFVMDLSGAGSLTVDWEGRSIATLSLVGSSDALLAVLACEKEAGVVASKAEAPGSGGGSDSGGHTSQGTGFYVSDRGEVVTNDHVIDGCRDITVTHVGFPALRARLIARDHTNDLAVLATDMHQDVVPPFALRARMGETVYAFGYPMNGLLATAGNFTIGNVTAKAGMDDDTGHLQMSTPVQPGNSGGPLVDAFGNVVGVIQSRLNGARTASNAVDVPQNVNFAIKSAVVMDFLDANGIPAPLGARSADAMDGEGVAERAKAFTVRVNCR